MYIIYLLFCLEHEDTEGIDIRDAVFHEKSVVDRHAIFRWGGSGKGDFWRQIHGWEEQQFLVSARLIIVIEVAIMDYKFQQDSLLIKDCSHGHNSGIPTLFMIVWLFLDAWLLLIIMFD